MGIQVILQRRQPGQGVIIMMTATVCEEQLGRVALPQPSSAELAHQTRQASDAAPCAAPCALFRRMPQ